MNNAESCVAGRVTRPHTASVGARFHRIDFSSAAALASPKYVLGAQMKIRVRSHVFLAALEAATILALGLSERSVTRDGWRNRPAG
jgi:hypothetical protein